MWVSASPSGAQVSEATWAAVCRRTGAEAPSGPFMHRLHVCEHGEGVRAHWVSVQVPVCLKKMTLVIFQSKVQSLEHVLFYLFIFLFPVGWGVGVWRGVQNPTYVGLLDHAPSLLPGENAVENQLMGQMSAHCEISSSSLGNFETTPVPFLIGQTSRGEAAVVNQRQKINPL